MKEEGVVVNSTELNEDEYRIKLKQKLLEEAKEVENSDSIAELTVELSDVLEVIHALAESHEIDFADIESSRLRKREVNGYFSRDIYVHYIEVDHSNTKVIDYLLNPKRPYKFT